MTKKPAAREFLSPRAFGQALGVSRQAVQKAMASGRLSASLQKDARTGHHLIDLELGKAEWEEWTDPTKRQSPEARAGGRPTDGARSTPSLFDPAQNAQALQGRATLVTTRTEQVALAVEIQRIELEQLRGNLVDKREVQREAFRLSRHVLDRILAIPDRISANLAALDKPAAVHQALTAELTRALEELSQLTEGAA